MNKTAPLFFLITTKGDGVIVISNVNIVSHNISYATHYEKIRLNERFQNTYLSHILISSF